MTNGEIIGHPAIYSYLMVLNDIHLLFCRLKHGPGDL
jgi:hypothetical protein